MYPAETTHDAATAAADTADVLARAAERAAASKANKHPKYAFRAAIQSSRELKGATKLVALLLADFVNVADGYAYPTVSEIMDKLGMPETTVHRALRNLQERVTPEGVVVPGWFRREAMKSRNGADARNHWHPIYARAGISDSTAESDRVGCQNDRVGCHQRHPRVPSTAPLILTGYEPDSVKGDGLATLAVSVSNESKNPSDSAAAQQQDGGPGFASRDGEPKAQRQPVDRIALPEGCPFDPDDIAKRHDLTAEDVAAAEASFREKTAGKSRSPAEWARTAKAWLRRQKPIGDQPSDKGTLFPAVFMLEPVMLQEAAKLGLTQTEASEATAAFVDDRRSAVGLKAYSRDWNASWRGWVRGAAERKKRSQGFQKPKGAV